MTAGERLTARGAAAVALIGLLGACTDARASGLSLNLAGAPASSSAPLRIEIDTAKENASARWDEAARALGHCVGADVIVWYAAGSAVVKVRPSPHDLCSVEMTMDLEGAGWRFACTLPKDTVWTWNLVFAPGPKRDPLTPLPAPPRTIPSNLQPQCRDVK
jgi:hypothetical protein